MTNGHYQLFWLNYFVGFSPVMYGNENHKRNQSGVPGSIFFSRSISRFSVPVLEILIPAKLQSCDISLFILV